MEPLVRSPAFVMNVPRSGSTLLRCILDSHQLIHAPHQLHLSCLEVKLATPHAELAMNLLGFGSRELEHLLWDRILHHELTRSGKQVIVGKDPLDLLQWKRLREAWPEARYIFLLRHPGAIYASAIDSRRRVNELAAQLRATSDRNSQTDAYTANIFRAANGQAPNLEHLVDRIELLEEARHSLPGLTIRYEDLVSNAERVTRKVCAFLNVPWDARMLDYGTIDHGPLIWGTGDTSDKIKTGRIMPPRTAPTAEAMPAPLISACRTWGYV